MSVMDVQLQIWQSQLDLWRRMFDMQISMTRGVIDFSSAWTWRAVDVARDVAEAEQERAEEVVETATRVMRAAPKADQPKAGAPVEDAEVIAEKVAEAVEATVEPAAEAAEAVTEVVEQAAETVAKAAEEPVAPKPAAPKRPRAAPARRSAPRTTTARRPRGPKS